MSDEATRKVFLSGSLGFTPDVLPNNEHDRVQRQVKAFADRNDQILIGDANRGLDDDAANQLSQMNYNNVTIAGTNSYARGDSARQNTNNGNWDYEQVAADPNLSYRDQQVVRDAHLVDQADQLVGFMVPIDPKNSRISRGTLRNMTQGVEQGKNVGVYYVQDNQLKSQKLQSMNDLDQIVNSYGDDRLGRVYEGIKAQEAKREANRVANLSNEQPADTQAFTADDFNETNQPNDNDLNSLDASSSNVNDQKPVDTQAFTADDFNEINQPNGNDLNSLDASSSNVNDQKPADTQAFTADDFNETNQPTDNDLNSLDASSSNVNDQKPAEAQAFTADDFNETNQPTDNDLNLDPSDSNANGNVEAKPADTQAFTADDFNETNQSNDEDLNLDPSDSNVNGNVEAKPADTQAFTADDFNEANQSNDEDLNLDPSDSNANGNVEAKPADTKSFTADDFNEANQSNDEDLNLDPSDSNANGNVEAKPADTQAFTADDFNETNQSNDEDLNLGSNQSQTPVSSDESLNFGDEPTSTNQQSTSTSESTDYTSFDMLHPLQAQAPESRNPDPVVNGSIDRKKLKFFDHQTLLLMALQKLRDPKDNKKPLLSNKELVSGLGNSKEEAHERLVNTSSDLKDLDQLGIPKIQSALIQGTLNQKTWNDAKIAAFKEAKAAESTDSYSTKNRTVKDQPIGAVNFTDPEYPDNLWTQKSGSFPPVLTYQGDKSLLNDNQKPSMAVVGSSKVNDAVEVVTHNYGARLSIDGVNSIGGLEGKSDLASARGNLDYLDRIKDNQAAYQKAGKPIEVIAKGLNTSLGKGEPTDLAKQVVSHGGVLVSPYAPNDRPQGAQYFAQSRDRYRVMGVMADATIGTQVGEQPAKNGNGKFADDAKPALLEALDHQRPLAMLDPNQLEPLKNKKLGDAFEYNQMNINRGNSMGLGSVVGSQNVVNQFANLKDAAIKRHQTRLTQLRDPNLSNQVSKNNQPNNGNEGIDF